VLKELPAFWGRSISNNDLAAIALNLGSDVPYFLQRGSAYATGRGEVLDHFETDFPFAILVSFPNIHVSTAWAYQQVKPRGTSQTTLKDELLDAMRAPEKLGAALRNDFEPVVFNAHPEIGAAKDSMLSSGALAAALSGSGSAVFGLYESSAKAEEAGKQFERSGHRVFITREGFRVAN
jgi:4-diphosphocytidyl-2-C-methyl-D-erythritol kinase